MSITARIRTTQTLAHSHLLHTIVDDDNKKILRKLI